MGVSASESDSERREKVLREQRTSPTCAEDLGLEREELGIVKAWREGMDTKTEQ